MEDHNMSSEEIVARNIENFLISGFIFELDKQTQSDEGTNYKPLYYGMFNGVTSIIENTVTYEQVIAALKHLQSMAEDAYIKQS